MAYTIKIVRSDGNPGSNLWYKGSGGLKDCDLDENDTTSGWTNVYADRKKYDSEPSTSDVNTIKGYLPSDNRSLFPNNGTSLIASVVTE